MKKHLTTCFLCIVLILGHNLTTQAQTQIGHDIDGEGITNLSGNSVSMPDANTIAIGAPDNNAGGLGAGHVRIYTWNGIEWIQKGSDIDGEAHSDKSGSMVCMPDKNTVAIGAPDNGSVDAGHVRIYRWNGAWVQKGMDIDGEAADDHSGTSLSMPDSNTIAIGAPYNFGNFDSDGQVRIYKWDGNTWVQKGMDIYGEGFLDFSGMSVSMPDSNTVAIGALMNDGGGNNSGHVRIYIWNGSTWVQKGIDIDGKVALDMSCACCMPDNNTVAIGAMNSYSNAGSVCIYNWNGSAWVQKGIDIIGEAPGDYAAGASMPNPNTIAIGACHNDGTGPDAGHVRIYTWIGSTWVQKGIDIDGEFAGDFAGCACMPDENTVGIGAPYNDGNGSLSGHVRIFKLKGASGLIYSDFNQNCIHENEVGIMGRKIILQPGNIVSQTSYNGYWVTDSLPVGTYSITLDTTGNWLSTCPTTQYITITNPDSLYYAPSFGLVSTDSCPSPDISINMPFIRRGFSNQIIYIQACNTYNTAVTLNNAYVEVSLDPLITLNSATLSYIALGNNTFSFNLDTIYPGQCIDFEIFATVSNSAIIGKTLCLEAKLFPVDSCVLDTIPNIPPPGVSPCTSPWDRSSLDVDGWCQNDSIFFTITNTSPPVSGDMQCYSAVRLYIDGQYIWLDSVLLAGGETDTLVFLGDGRTWRLEVDQNPLYPGNSNPNATVELCGDDTNWTPNLVNILPHNDMDPVVDIYCGIVSSSYDPNDKKGQPFGVSPNHYIAANQKIDYVIRFQNTGNDTAFTVIIRDTLDTDLNIFSVQEGSSSHNYSFRMYGPRVLEWEFSHILLPDSTTNYEGSNGFVSFTVEQEKNLPDNTEINNSAAIYFDYNPPVITNKTSHIINSTINMAGWTERKTISATACNKYTYNGITYRNSGTYWQIISGLGGVDTLLTINLTIDYLDISVTSTLPTLTANLSGAIYQWLDCNNAMTIMSGETNQSYTVTANGSYAVEIIQYGCVDTSACQLVNNLGIQDKGFSDALSIYPNPTKGIITIECEGMEKVEVIDITGKLVYELPVSSNVLEIDISVFSKGIYFVKVRTEDDIAVERIVLE